MPVHKPMYMPTHKFISMPMHKSIHKSIHISTSKRAGALCTSAHMFIHMSTLTLAHMHEHMSIHMSVRAHKLVSTPGPAAKRPTAPCRDV